MAETFSRYSTPERSQIVAGVEDYRTGRVLDTIKQTFDVLEAFGGSINESKIGAKMLEEAKKFDPRQMSIEKAS
jgi:hypothetical protein